jgi:hypothetical protein
MRLLSDFLGWTILLWDSWYLVTKSWIYATALYSRG